MEDNLLNKIDHTIFVGLEVDHNLSWDLHKNNVFKKLLGESTY